MIPEPQEEPAELKGKDYRIRMISLEMFLDIYDDNGMLEDRSTSNKLVITEAKFPDLLVTLLAQSTNLARGFAKLRPVAQQAKPEIVSAK